MQESTVLKLGVASVLALLTAAAALTVSHEMQTSEWQAGYLAGLGGKLRYAVAEGTSDGVRFPAAGPFDQRQGYTGLPQFVKRLGERGFAVTRQAHWSESLTEVADRGLYTPYHEKAQAGLEILDQHGQAVFSSRYPGRVFDRFESVPPLLVDTLLFIENRELLDPTHPKRNPAVEWDRLGMAAIDQLKHRLYASNDSPGGSTLATQMEKYRHSPFGYTPSIEEKIRQMASASVRAYLDGEETLEARRRIVLKYLNTVPLAAKLGYGEVNGVGDGLWAWYGRDFGEATRLLTLQPQDAEQLAARAQAYKEALSLMIAQRRPAYYFNGHGPELEELTDAHARLLARAGVIDEGLRDAVLAARLKVRDGRLDPPPASFVTRKAANAIRAHLAGALGMSNLYDLDRLDLTVKTTLDQSVQKTVTGVLRGLRDPQATVAAGLKGPYMLERGDPAKLMYSFTLYERVGNANLLRLQTDNFDQPFDINSGAKLDLGSTAKLRTVVTYLEVIAQLHERYADQNRKSLLAARDQAEEALTRWAVEYLLSGAPKDLDAMLAAAVERRYSADPGVRFYTGGGLQTYSNFKHEDDGKLPTVREALQDSVNLAFIRIMRDVVRYYMFQTPGSTAKLLEDANDPRRREYLARFADREGKVFINRFYQKYHGKTPAEAELLLLQSVRATPSKLSAVHRTLAPKASAAGFGQFLRAHLPGRALGEDKVTELYGRFAPEAMSLADRGYVAGVHPLELWLVGFLREYPGATRAQATEASADERQAVYQWLFKTRSKNAQDRRIQSLLEVEGFLEIHRAWKRLGYPFASLTPSYGTSLGASADRPAALAELMGIILNDGRRLPIRRVEHLSFAVDTPYETHLEPAGSPGEQVMAPEVAKVAKALLLNVVENGTARRIHDAFKNPDGSLLPVGGKTGTGDHRREIFGRGGRMVASQVVSRSGTFVFFIGERFFGTVTAYVPGRDAAGYRFTSSLPVQLLKHMAPQLMPILNPNVKLVAAARPAA